MKDSIKVLEANTSNIISEIKYDELDDFIEKFSPLSKENVNQTPKFPNTSKDGCRLHYGISLHGLIKFLQDIEEEYGDMPVLYYKNTSKTFSTPCFVDIDVINKYFKYTGNMKESFIRVYNEKALSFFTA